MITILKCMTTGKKGEPFFHSKSVKRSDTDMWCRWCILIESQKNIPKFIASQNSEGSLIVHEVVKNVRGSSGSGRSRNVGQLFPPVFLLFYPLILRKVSLPDNLDEARPFAIGMAIIKACPIKARLFIIFHSQTFLLRAYCEKKLARQY